MKYDFDKVIDRRGTASMKWDVAEGELPMWVADMDFQTAPEITDALKKRLEHGVFGYSVIPEEWYDAYRGWWKERHGYEIGADELIFCTGVVPAISSIVRKLTTPNENVVILTPVYNIFFNSIINNGARVLESNLKYVRCEDTADNGNAGILGTSGHYEIDFDDLEKKLADLQTSLMIFCNPHNPVGKIWSREELAKVGRLCREYGVTVISDEIHCDLTRPGRDYIPFGAASPECADVSIQCIAPTKAFNLAGLQTAAVCIKNRFLRHKVWRALNTDEVAEPNAFAVTAAVAAFKCGGEWLDELREYLFENRRIAEEFIRDNIPLLKTVEADATYLMWADISETGLDSETFCDEVRRSTGLFVTAGEEYGECGRNFIRLNLACPRSVLNDGLNRLARGTGQSVGRRTEDHA
ncbi:MAG: pyridoxal phosphate-dependent aminotransferase [Lachnospiraceae bacterium]|nr:pyridoxal phosphate-dependent aminotransferase [Lachnospiraceae bacterium]